MRLDLLAERFRCGAALASQYRDLVVDVVAQRFEPCLDLGGFRPVISASSMTCALICWPSDSDAARLSPASTVILLSMSSPSDLNRASTLAASVRLFRLVQ